MHLTKDGVTFEVQSKADIDRLKRAGYVEELEQPAIEQTNSVDAQVEPKATKGKGNK